jgi:hypothetical protein
MIDMEKVRLCWRVAWCERRGSKRADLTLLQLFSPVHVLFFQRTLIIAVAVGLGQVA